jgi:outer membrane protein TolC
MYKTGHKYFYAVSSLFKSGKRTIIYLIVSAIVCLLSFSPLYSQHDSLNKYLEISEMNNQALSRKINEYKAALQKIPQAGSLPDPELSAGIFLKPMELVSGSQAADLRLMQMFPWFGVLKSAKDEMSLMAKAKYESLRDETLQLGYDVQRTWYELYRIRQNISVSEKNLELLKSLEKLALVKFQSATVSVQGSQVKGQPDITQSAASPAMAVTSGMQSMQQNRSMQTLESPMPSSGGMDQSSMGQGTAMPGGLTDLYQIQIESAELESEIEGLRDQDRATVAKFNSYLNRSPMSNVFTPVSLDPDTLSLSLLSVPDSILKNNPMLGMLDYEIKSAEAREKMVKGMGYPMVGLGVNYSVIGNSAMSASDMNGKDMIMPMVSLTLPVYRKKYNAMAAEADLLKSAAMNGYNSAANTLQTEFFLALQQYQDAKRRVRLYKFQSELAARSLDITLRSFSASEASLSEVLRIRQQTYDYELKASEAVADLNTSAALLKRLMAFSEIK